MNDGSLDKFLGALGGGDLWTIIAKAVFALGLGILWLIWSGKLKKAQNDAANKETNKTQGDQMADTAKDTQEVAGDANAAADKIDEFHRRKP